MNKQTGKKILIAEKAAEKYLKNDRFTIQSLADDLNMKSADVFDFFPNRSSILLFYYESRIDNYNEQIKSIKDYESYTLSEKLSNFILSLLDQFKEHREFVLLTYKSLVIKNCRDSKFKERFIETVTTIFIEDKNRSASSSIILNNAFYTILLYHFHALIEFWSNDESIQSQNTMALVDKWTAFIEELFYTSIVDKGFDLTKFLFYQSPLGRVNINSCNFRSNNE